MRSVDVHQATSPVGGIAVAGRTAGLSELGDQTTWRARFWGLPVTVTTRVTGFEPGRAYAERRVAGLPRVFSHDVRFDPVGDGCRITDRFRLVLPGGPVGRLVGELAVRRRMQRALEVRLERIRQLAEGDLAA